MEKRKSSRISPQKPPWKMPGNTSRIKIKRWSSGKLGGKSGKHRGKLTLFFTNSVENPVEKVDKSIWKAQKWIQPAVLAEGGSDSQPPFVHMDFLEWPCQT
ncbi:hypothetical protein [Faecalibacterium prausnitzii]|uniref:hypothetical protein n=1 Tax=Faecalibacterium prausnitzii TaxID=853 RepID=UPI002665DD94|nr:hypothetical protein [Faecalibacterium prausnitzii]